MRPVHIFQAAHMAAHQQIGHVQKEIPLQAAHLAAYAAPARARGALVFPAEHLATHQPHNKAHVVSLISSRTLAADQTLAQSLSHGASQPHTWRHTH
ncbi:MAG: hypothetical protein M0Z50_11605 [Planctomycetia bacterium]|nr:hypothetical protein [Planctomycetia bacterium]